jgi:UDP-N-acetylglucosamine enolpyruvyl transferase
MIEIGSFIGLAAITKSEITIKNVAYVELGDHSFRILKNWGLKWNAKEMIFIFLHKKAILK